LQLNLGIGAVTQKILLVYLIPVVAGMVLQRLLFPIATAVARIAARISKVAGLLLVLLIAVIGAKPLISLRARSGSGRKVRWVVICS
jgi:predicted Na+-dependent transporter